MIVTRVKAVLAFAAGGALAIRTQVVLMSIDGLGAKQLDDENVSIPNLRRIIKEGAYSREGIESVFPAMTFPAHTSMVTGQYPKGHGIAINCEDVVRAGALTQDPICYHHHFYEDIKVPTVFQLAINSGVKVAAVDWPVTIGLNGTEVYPGNIGIPASYEQAAWLHNALRGELVRKQFPDIPSLYRVNDEIRGTLASEIIKQPGPKFVAVHLDDLDGAQHQAGVRSPHAREVLETADRQIGKILDAIRQSDQADSTVLLVTSDHGHVNVTKTVLIQEALYQKGLVGSVVRRFHGSTGGVFPIYVLPTATQGDRERLEGVVDALKDDAQYSISKVWRDSELVSVGGYDGAYMAVEFALGTDFRTECCGECGSVDCKLLVNEKDTDFKAQHGYSHEHDEMNGVLLAWGLGIKKGKKLTDVPRLVDIGPTLAHVLGLGEIPGAHPGEVIWELFAENTDQIYNPNENKDVENSGGSATKSSLEANNTKEMNTSSQPTPTDTPTTTEAPGIVARSSSAIAVIVLGSLSLGTLGVGVLLAIFVRRRSECCDWLIGNDREEEEVDRDVEWMRMGDARGDGEESSDDEERMYGDSRSSL